MDYYASSDFEDIITVLDGRSEITSEIKQSSNDIKNYLITTFTDIYNSRSFQGAIPGHFVKYGNLAKDRIALLENKIETIIKS